MMIPGTDCFMIDPPIPVGSRVVCDGDLVTLVAYSTTFDVSGSCLVRTDSGEVVEVRREEITPIAGWEDQLFLVPRQPS